jgi:hypothetical protein
MKRLEDIPPCPDPEKYILVKTREGNFWRKKRGLGKKGAILNEGFRQSCRGMAITAPAAKRIVTKLRPFLEGLAVGRITVRISALLRKKYNQSGNVDYTYLSGLELQPDYPIKRLLKEKITTNIDNDLLEIRIPISQFTIKPQGKLVTHFYFEMILVSGDCTKDNNLRIEAETSVVYSIETIHQDDCRFIIPLGKNSWFAILKVCCIEGQELAISPKDYGMKVISVG